MINFLKGRLRTPSAVILAQRELEDAKRELLESLTGLEYAQAMVAYNQQRVARLQQYVTGDQNGNP